MNKPVAFRTLQKQAELALSEIAVRVSYTDVRGLIQPLKHVKDVPKIPFGPFFAASPYAWRFQPNNCSDEPEL